MSALPSFTGIDERNTISRLKDILILENLRGDDLLKRAFELSLKNPRYKLDGLDHVLARMSDITGLSYIALEEWALDKIKEKI